MRRTLIVALTVALSSCATSSGVRYASTPETLPAALFQEDAVTTSHAIARWCETDEGGEVGGINQNWNLASYSDQAVTCIDRPPLRSDPRGWVAFTITPVDEGTCVVGTPEADYGGISTDAIPTGPVSVAFRSNPGRQLGTNTDFVEVLSDLGGSVEDEHQDLCRLVAPPPPPVVVPEVVVGTSWCAGNEATLPIWAGEEVYFTLENEKTVSICRSGDSDLTFFYGVLGEPPEMEHRAPLVLTLEGLSGFGHSFAELASRPVFAAAMETPDSGFFVIASDGVSGGEEASVLFRHDGWEYAVRMGSSRSRGPDPESEWTEWRVIDRISPDGNSSTIRAPDGSAQQ